MLEVGSVYRHPVNGIITITDGFYLDPTYHRFSNHWSWRRVMKNGTLGRKTFHGYGERWPKVAAKITTTYFIKGYTE